ncbi:Cleavage stimulation factor subunit [Trichinella spiralis]|uniref:Cleavage stimulation factor 50 kDa subunit n=1 Tax=Trichinella spiralis TaxID=6334 RepID=A0ABR3KP90_TRISP
MALNGRDGVVKLWELRANRCLIIYTGASSTGLERHRIQAVFNHNEDYVLYPEEHSNSLCSWDSRTGERKRLLALGHTAPVRGFAHSPTQAAFVSYVRPFANTTFLYLCCKNRMQRSSADRRMHKEKLFASTASVEF